MTRLHVPRLDLHVAGLDPALVQEALDLLPRALERALTSAVEGTAGSGPGEPASDASARLPSTPSAAELARHLSVRVAARVSAQVIS